MTPTRAWKSMSIEYNSMEEFLTTSNLPLPTQVFPVPYVAPFHFRHLPCVTSNDLYIMHVLPYLIHGFSKP